MFRVNKILNHKLYVFKVKNRHMITSIDTYTFPKTNDMLKISNKDTIMKTFKDINQVFFINFEHVIASISETRRQWNVITISLLIFESLDYI